MELQECRRALDEIDKTLVELFEKRMEICGFVAESKMGTGKAVRDEKREAEKLESVCALAHGTFNQTAVRELFEQIMTVSRRYQYRLMAERGRKKEIAFQKIRKLETENARIVYQGVEGAYSHAAAISFFGRDANLSHVEQFEDAMRVVQEGGADFAVLPIENSSAGAVVDMYDLFSRYENVIVAETFLPVNHALLGLPEAEFSQIQTVYSHPQALMQCSQFLNGNAWKQVSYANTAMAARKILEDRDPSQAAVASEIAGSLYGLKVLQSEIQNQKGNTTRFVILSNKPVYCEGAGKISLCFELPHHSGTLYNILGNFIYNGVNMIMIESRPVPGKQWEYRFFVDIEGSLEDMAVINALEGIAAEALNLRILGNYITVKNV